MDRIEEQVVRLKKEFRDQLERAQKEAGVSTRELADRAGLGPATVYFWKACRNFPRLETLVMIGEILGKDIEIKLVDKEGPA